MARARRALSLAAALAAAVVLVAPAVARAQSLRLLHVEALGMRADRSQLRVGEIFHLAIHLRVAENVSALDELIVPDVGTMQLLGDERNVSHGAYGTDVVETLTLEPTQRGRYTFAPAYLDAIDPHSLRPTRYSADHGVTVVVADPAVVVRRDAWAIGTALASVLTALVIVAAVALALLGRIRPRRERSGVADVGLCLSNGATAPPPRAPSTRRERVAEALQAYRRKPGTVALERLRAELFGAAGSTAGATLRDALASLRNGHGDGDPVLTNALRAAESAAFGPSATREAASRDLVDATEAWLRR